MNLDGKAGVFKMLRMILMENEIWDAPKGKSIVVMGDFNYPHIDKISIRSSHDKEVQFQVSYVCLRIVGHGTDSAIKFNLYVSGKLPRKPNTVTADFKRSTFSKMRGLVF